MAIHTRGEQPAEPRAHVRAHARIVPRYFSPRQQIVPLLQRRNGCVGGGVARYPTPYDGEQGLFCVAEGDCVNAAEGRAKGRGGNASGLMPGMPPQRPQRHTPAVVRCSWDGDHGWPVGIETYDFAMRLIWDFFLLHCREAALARVIPQTL